MSNEAERTLKVQLSEPRAIALAGELDLSTCGLLTEAAAALLTGEGDIRLECSDLTFIDSSGIREVVRIANTLGRRGKLIILRPQPAVARVLAIVDVGAVPNITIETDSATRRRRGRT